MAKRIMYREQEKMILQAKQNLPKNDISEAADSADMTVVLVALVVTKEDLRVMTVDLEAMEADSEVTMADSEALEAD